MNEKLSMFPNVFHKIDLLLQMQHSPDEINGDCIPVHSSATIRITSKNNTKIVICDKEKVKNEIGQEAYLRFCSVQRYQLLLFHIAVRRQFIL